MAYQGIFKPRNPQKYKGDPSNIIYRSSWELKFMMYCDNQPNILEWSSEEIVIRYRSPLDRKIHRYFPDFYVKKLSKDNTIECLIVEIKPEEQSRPPKPHNNKNGKPSKKYLKEVYTWGINSAKWAAARAYCAEKGWKFMVLGKKDLNIKF